MIVPTSKSLNLLKFGVPTAFNSIQGFIIDVEIFDRRSQAEVAVGICSRRRLYIFGSSDVLFRKHEPNYLYHEMFVNHDGHTTTLN